jgi:hypothetical protein
MANTHTTFTLATAFDNSRKRRVSQDVIDAIVSLNPSRRNYSREGLQKAIRSILSQSHKR